MLFYRKIRSPKQAGQVMTSERNTLIRKMASSPGTDIQVLGKDKRKEKPLIYLTVSFKTMSHDLISCFRNILYFKILKTVLQNLIDTHLALFFPCYVLNWM